MLNFALAIAGKDLRILLQGPAAVIQGLLLGLLIIFVFSISVEAGASIPGRTAATIFWLASLFYAILAFNQLYGLEETNASRQALYLAPAPAQGIWLGKALAGLGLLALAQLIFLPGVAIFLGQDLKGPPWPGLMALAVADVGIAAAGSMLGALAQGHRAAESLPGIVLFPLLAPLLLAAISLGAASLEDGRELDNLGWLGIGLAFDAIFLGLGLMLSGLLYQGRS